MRKLRLIILFILGIIYIFYSFYKDTINKNEVDKRGLEDLNLQLVGVVDSVTEITGYNNYGIIQIRILQSNISLYDPRTTQKFYYCFIRNGKAEIYDHTFDTCKGDTITINTKTKLRSDKNKSKNTGEGSITINRNEGYYDYINGYHARGGGI
jgi:hypothetical protein